MKTLKGLSTVCLVAFVVFLLYHFVGHHSTLVLNSGGEKEGQRMIQQLLSNPPGLKKEFVYSSLPSQGVEAGHQLIRLHWTSLGGTTQANSYHFFSAYFDGRASQDLHRPAVLILGYVNRDVPTLKFYCLFRYANRSVCRENNAIERHVSPCFAPNLRARPYHYICEMSPTEEVPLAVHLSTSDTCKPDSVSDPIPVQNRNSKIDDKAPKKFGVCLSAPLVKEKPTFGQDVIEYVEMSKAVGVQQIVFYVNEELTDMNVVKTLWKRYPDLVKTVAWRKFDKWDPLHYYGQVILVNDCFYRNMYEVDYLATTDFDEMITPVGNNSWDEMISAMNIKDDIATFTFQNAFFTAPKGIPKQVLEDCSDTPLPKYFSRTERHICFPGYKYRPKMMSRPRYVYEPSIHWSCAKVNGHDGWMHVPTEFGILAHYRPSLPADCIDKPAHIDLVATKFKDTVTRSMCTK